MTKTTKIKRCVTKGCDGVVRPPGVTRCKQCRAKHAVHHRHWRQRNPDQERERNRAQLAKRRERFAADPRSADAKKYSATTRAAILRWEHEHPFEKARNTRLSAAVKSGEIKRPKKCRCGKVTKVVAWWGESKGDLPEAWLCWECWWERKRAIWPRKQAVHP